MLKSFSITQILFLTIILLLFNIIENKSNLRHNQKLNNKNNNEKLLFVWEHFRHGARQPYTQINQTTWIDLIGVQWNGQGELTAIGSRMHYLLGISTKKKYKNFLSSSFNPNEIFIISSNFNRTIMSVAANLQGIYDNTTTDNLTDIQINNAIINNKNNSEKINEKIKDMKNNILENGINLLPIHIFSPKSYEFKINDADFCPGISKYTGDAKKLPKVKKLFDELIQITNEKYGDYIYKFMNISQSENPNYLKDFDTLHYICDTFVADYYENKSMPHIKNSGINMEEFYNFSVNLSNIDTYYSTNGDPLTKVTYITMSPIYRSIFNYMEKRIDLDKKGLSDKIISNSPKFVIVSGHDSTLGASAMFLQQEFGVEMSTAIYASGESYELWKNETNGKYFIKYLFNQEEKAIFDYDNFKKKIFEKIYTQKEVEDICEGREEKKQYLGMKISFYFLLMLVIVSICIIIYLRILIKRKNEILFNKIF